MLQVDINIKSILQVDINSLTELIKIVLVLVVKM